MDKFVIKKARLDVANDTSSQPPAVIVPSSSDKKHSEPRPKPSQKQSASGKGRSFQKSWLNNAITSATAERSFRALKRLKSSSINNGTEAIEQLGCS